MNKIFTIIIFSILFIGCGINDNIKKSETRIAKRLTSVSTNNHKAEDRLLKHTELNKYKVYLNFSDFNKSKEFLNLASSDLKKLKKIIKKDDSDDEGVANALINRITDNLNKSSNFALKPINDLRTFSSLDKNRVSITTKATKDIQLAFATIENSMNLISTALNKDKKLPTSTSDVFNSEHKRFLVLKSELLTLSNQLVSPDLKLFEKTLNSTKLKISKINTLSKSVETQLKEISSSYIKILSDMKESHYLTIGSVSWDDYDDYPSEHSYKFRKVKISITQRDKFIKVNSTFGTASKFLGSISVSSHWTSKNELQSLGINISDGFSWGDSDLEFFIEDIEDNYFHKYTEVINDKKTASNWVSVSQDYYLQNYANLGMSLVSKPYGVLDSNSSIAVPAGLNLVGNNNYGEWKSDSSGHSFWHYYGIYSFLTSGSDSRYSRSSYNDYNKRDRHTPYYGSGTKNYGTYGSRNSSFRKTHRVRPSSKIASYRKSHTRTKSSSRSSRSSSLKSVQRKSSGRGPSGRGK